MSTRKVYVCGDSFFSCWKSCPGTHFSELLAKNLKFKLYNLARAGISNSSIRLQIGEALRNQADFILIGATDHMRFEVPLHSLWATQPKKNYNAEVGIHNMDYRCSDNLSQKFILNQQHATMWSDHWSKYQSEEFNPVFRQAWKNYVSYILDMNYKQQQDTWIIESALAVLLHSNTNFLYMPNGHHVPDWLPKRHVLDLNIKAEYQVVGDHYHTTQKDQIHIAERVEQCLVQRQLL